MIHIFQQMQQDLRYEQDFTRSRIAYMRTQDINEKINDRAQVQGPKPHAPKMKQPKKAMPVEMEVDQAIHIDCSIKEAAKTAEALRDGNIQKLLDVTLEPINSNCWIVLHTELQDRDQIITDITNILSFAGCREFEIN